MSSHIEIFEENNRVIVDGDYSFAVATTTKGDKGDPGPKGDKGDTGPQGLPGGVSSVVSPLELDDGELSLDLGDLDFGNLVPKERTVTGASGLTGGGDLSANRTLSIESGGVTTTKIANDAVTGIKIGSNEIVSAHLDNASVITRTIANDAVTSPKIADGVVETSKIADKSVTTAKLASATIVLPVADTAARDAIDPKIVGQQIILLDSSPICLPPTTV